MTKVAVLSTKEEQQIAMEIAWRSVRDIVEKGEAYFPDIEELPQPFQQKSGAFVTAYTVSGKKEELRGCIGIPQPVYPLGEAIAKSARDTVSADPRFPPVKIEELERIILEVEVLTPFQKIEYTTLDELYEQIEIGVDGLMLSSGYGKGLLLPPVPVKYKWDAKRFLSALCEKAWVPESSILEEGTTIYKFQAQVIR